MNDVRRCDPGPLDRVPRPALVWGLVVTVALGTGLSTAVSASIICHSLDVSWVSTWSIMFCVSCLLVPLMLYLMLYVLLCPHASSRPRAISYVTGCIWYGFILIPVYPVIYLLPSRPASHPKHFELHAMFINGPLSFIGTVADLVGGLRHHNHSLQMIKEIEVFGIVIAVLFVCFSAWVAIKILKQNDISLLLQRSQVEAALIALGRGLRRIAVGAMWVLVLLAINFVWRAHSLLSLALAFCASLVFLVLAILAPRSSILLPSRESFVLRPTSFVLLALLLILSLYAVSSHPQSDDPLVPLENGIGALVGYFVPACGSLLLANWSVRCFEMSRKALAVIAISNYICSVGMMIVLSRL